MASILHALPEPVGVRSTYDIGEVMIQGLFSAKVSERWSTCRAACSPGCSQKLEVKNRPAVFFTIPLACIFRTSLGRRWGSGLPIGVQLLSVTNVQSRFSVFSVPAHDIRHRQPTIPRDHLNKSPDDLSISSPRSSLDRASKQTDKSVQVFK